MTDEEIIQARNALKQWFLSQGISPANAGLVMSNLLAEQFVIVSKDIKELTGAASLFKALLIMDIAGELHK